MTLIVAGLANGVVYQIGDRLVSTRIRRRLSDWDPDANKQILVVCKDAMMAIGYTGLAYLGEDPTDVAIAEAVAGRTLGAGFGLGINVGTAYEAIERLRETLARRWAVEEGSDPGLEVDVVGIKRGKRRAGSTRMEPLTWNLASSRTFRIERSEQAPFNWQKSFAVSFIGTYDEAHIRETVAHIKAQLSPSDREGFREALIELVRYHASASDIEGVGPDIMAATMWREDGRFIVEVEYLPERVEVVTLDRGDRQLVFPPAYTPWVLTPWFVSGPAIATIGGWSTGPLSYRVKAPATPYIFYGSQERHGPPG